MAMQPPKIDLAAVRSPELLAQRLGELVRYVEGSQRQIEQALAQVQQQQSAPSIGEIRKQLELGGEFPLNITGLVGRAAEPQTPGLFAGTALPRPENYPAWALFVLQSGSVYRWHYRSLTLPPRWVELTMPAPTGPITVTSPWTFSPSSGTVAINITAGQFNSASQFGCSVNNTATQSIPNNVLTAVAFDAEVYDIGGMHDNAVNNSRLTVPTGGDGRWLIIGQVTWAASVLGGRILRLYANGATQLADSHVPHGDAGGAASVCFQVSAIVPAAATNYFECVVLQDTGAALNVTSPNTKMWAHKLA